MNRLAYMTKEECDKKVHIPRWVFNLMLTIMGLFVVLVGMAASSSQNAACEAMEAARATEKVGSALELHEKVAFEKEKAISNGINALRQDLKEYHADQKKATEQYNELIQEVIALKAKIHDDTR